MNSRRFAISDIHGCANTFSALVHDVLRIRTSDTVYLLGDYTDRGPRSKGVIDQILELQSKGFPVYPIRGNHDEMILRACGNLDIFRIWMLNGGSATLTSFDVDDPCELPNRYRRFFVGLPYYLELDDYIIVHAGLNFQSGDPFSDKEAMLWTRSEDIKPEMIGRKKVIVGHTPVSRKTIRQSLQSGLIHLDNGCVYATNAQLGTLCALDLDTLSLFFQKNID
ncbi:MAG: serine/threonine protein phosphatase [Deltaproteobacteria bacterium]|nr:serine/threonine protein phosphatase [Deltaproteobacteria bacterium]